MKNNYNKRFKMNGFTLVELLAVIVILAIILVIAVPKVMSVIEDSKKATLESTAKMIASSAEKQKVQNTVLGNTDAITCDSVAKINDLDYASCDITFENNTAKVTIEGSGKFAGLWVCDGTKTSAEASEEECNTIEYTDVACFTYEENEEYQGIEITNYDFDCGGEVVIPEKINNTPVVKIGDESFDAFIYDPSEESNDNFEYTITTLEGKLTNGRINSLRVIDDEQKITKLILPKTIKEIGSYAFEDNKITELDLSKLTQLTKIGNYAFNENDITNLKLPTSIQEIGNYAFKHNDIRDLDLSHLTQLTKIGSYAFYASNIVSELNLASSVEYIGSNAFGYNRLASVNLQNLEAEIGYCGLGEVTDIEHNLPDTYDCEEE